MSLIDHIKYSSIPSLVLFPIVGVNTLYFFLASILIDVDHYPMYIIETGSFSIRGMFRYYDELFKYVKNNAYLGLCMFHTVEFLIIIFFLSFYYSVVFYALLGIIFHLVLDTIFLYNNGHLSKRAFSIIEYVIRKKRFSSAKSSSANALRRYPDGREKGII